MRRARKTVRAPPEGPVLERGEEIQAILGNHAHKDSSADLEARFHGKGAGYDGYVMVCMGFRTKRSYIFSAALEAERRGDGDAGGDGMKDPLNLLREAFDIYDSKKAPWEQSKEYFEKLKEFCDYSEEWRKEQEKTITRPHNKDAGETRMGTTEWDVFHELSAKRLKKNGIHL